MTRPDITGTARPGLATAKGLFSGIAGGIGNLLGAEGRAEGKLLGGVGDYLSGNVTPAQQAAVGAHPEIAGTERPGLDYLMGRVTPEQQQAVGAHPEIQPFGAPQPPASGEPPAIASTKPVPLFSGGGSQAIVGSPASQLTPTNVMERLYQPPPPVTQSLFPPNRRPEPGELPITIR